MIVECPECQTKFRLDDTKITPKGVKVRCSKCKHVFTASKQEGQDTIEIASDSAPSPKPQKPTAAPKPPPKDEFGDDSFNLKDETPAPKAADGFDDGLGDFSFKDETPQQKPAADPGNIDLDDFSFDEEPPPAKVSAPPPPPPPPSSAPASPSPESAGTDDDFGDFDFDEEPTASPVSPPPPKAQAPAPEKTQVVKPKAPGDDLDFDDFSDFSDDGAAKKQKQKKEDIGFGGDDFDLGAASNDSDSDSQPAPADPATTGGDDIQEFGDISLDDAKTGAKPPSAPPPSDEIDLGGSGGEDAEFKLDRGVGGHAAEEFKKSVGAADDAYAFNAAPKEPSDSEMPLAPREPSTQEEPRGRMAPARLAPEKGKKVAASGKKGGKGFVVFVIILVVIGGGLFYLNKQGKIQLGQIKQLKFSELSVDKIKEIFGVKKPDLPKDVIMIEPLTEADLFKITRADKKTLWAIQGKITNRFETSQWMILIEATVQDGENTRTAQALFGNVITSDQLKVLPIDEINKKLMGTEDENLNQRLILTNESAPFMIVFPGVTSDSPKLLPDSVKVIEHKEL